MDSKMFSTFFFKQKLETMEKQEKNLNQEKQSKKEQAINERATDGKEINPQVKQRQEKHQPRDTA